MPPPSSLTWSQIFPDVDGAPVKETVPPFERMRDFYNELGDAAESVADEFDLLVTDPEARFEGDAALAFAELTGTVSEQLRLVPPKVREVADIVDRHGSDLADLRVEVNAALARATTRWNEVQDEQQAVATAGQSMSTFESHLACLTADVDDGTRVTAETNVDNAYRTLCSARSRLDAAEDDLAESRREYNSLRDQYEDLDFATGYQLKQVGLGGLQDPGFWDKVWGGIKGFGNLMAGAFEDFIGGLVDMATALADGDFGAALWGLSRMLGGMLTILAVASLFFAGPLGPLVLFLATAKFVADALLFTLQIDGADGQTLGLGQLGLSALGMVGARFAVGTGSGAARTFPGTTMTRATPLADASTRLSGLRTAWATTAANGGVSQTVQRIAVSAQTGQSVTVTLGQSWNAARPFVANGAPIVNNAVTYGSITENSLDYNDRPTQIEVMTTQLDSLDRSPICAGNGNHLVLVSPED